MIAATSSGRSFRGLAQYLERGRSGQELGRVAWTADRNIGTSEPVIAARLMQATANANPRVELPVYHVSLSFDPRDAVTPEQMQHVADRLLKDLGLEEHQALMVAHRDRAHAHVHLMVNRVHPETMKAWERWQDRPVIERVLREEEHALGLRQVKGRLYEAPSLEQDKERSSPEPRLSPEEQREAEVRLLERGKEHLADYRASRSWDELLTRLEDHGLRLSRKGQGLVLTDGHHEVKASLLARDLSLKRLEARFGARYPGDDHQLTGIERGQLSPRVVEIVDGVADVEAGHRLTREQGRLSTALMAAKAGQHQLEDQVGRVAAFGRELDRSLAAVYRDPLPARERFEQLATSEGPERALKELRDHPEQLGALRTVDQKRALGLVIVADDTKARQEAVVAVHSATELFEARKRLSDRTAAMVAGAERNWNDALALVYRDPQKARRAFEEALARAGPEAATRQMADRPEVYGSMASYAARTDQQGRVRSISESAHVAAAWAKEVVAVRQATTPATLEAYVRESIPRLEDQLRAVTRERARQFDPELIERSVGRAIARLAPSEVLQLHRALTEPQRAVAAKIRHHVRDLALGRDELERD